MKENKRAFVTGATGFLGSVLVEQLLAEQWEVVALTHRSTTVPDQVVRVNGALDDRDTLLQGMTGCDAVFHLAACVSFAPAHREQLMAINRDGTRLLLECAQESGVEKVVVTSSACTLGVHSRAEAVAEDTECRPDWREKSAYLDSKRAQEEVCQEFHEKGQDVVMVLPTTVFGPGDRQLNSGIFFKQVMQQAVVIVPPGGTSIVDCADVARGHRAALQNGRSGERYVLTAENLHFRQIYEEVAASVPAPARLICLPGISRPILTLAARGYCLAQRLRGREEWQLTPQIINDAYAYKWYSANKAKTELGWQPRFSLADTIARALAYYRSNGLL